MHPLIVARPDAERALRRDDPLVEVLNEHELTNHVRDRVADVGFDAAMAELAVDFSYEDRVDGR